MKYNGHDISFAYYKNILYQIKINSLVTLLINIIVKVAVLYKKRCSFKPKRVILWKIGNFRYSILKLMLFTLQYDYFLFNVCLNFPSLFLTSSSVDIVPLAEKKSLIYFEYWESGIGSWYLVSQRGSNSSISVVNSFAQHLNTSRLVIFPSLNLQEMNYFIWYINSTINGLLW